MKLGNLVYATMIACAFASCSSNDEEGTTTPTVASTGTCTLSIGVSTGSTSATKAVYTGTDDFTATGKITNEDQIYNLTLVVFDESGNIVGRSSVTRSNPRTATDSLSISGLSAGKVQFLVLANVQANTDLTGLSSVFDAKTVALPTDGFVGNQIPMYSGLIKDVTLNAGNNYYGFYNRHTASGETEINQGKPVELVRNVARVDLAAVKLDVSSTYSAGTASFTMTDVVMNHVAQKGTFIGTSLPSDNTFTTYDAAPSFYKETATDATATQDASTGTASTLTKVPHAYFYVLPNTNSTVENNATTMVVKGTFSMKNGVNKTTNVTENVEPKVGYYPIVVGVSGTVSGGTTPTIAKNHIYKITLTVAGPGKSSVDGGERANFFVNCKVADWVTVSQAVVI